MTNSMEISIEISKRKSKRTRRKNEGKPVNKMGDAPSKKELLTERVVMYLSKSEKREFAKTARSLKLTLSAYNRLQCGYDSGIKAGAPKGNKNKKGKRTKR